ncbi:TPA: hypothetical protein DEB29_03505 [Candidatus Wolfebacteria bacterium]|nr:hypothetical protein [Candidatus Wolfebacteria bacterium]
MDQRQLQIVLKLQDEASKELRKISGEFATAEKSTSRWGGSLEYVASAAKYAATALGTAAIAGATWGIKVAADLQTAEVGMTTLLGSAEKARTTMNRLKKEAARTPFELPGLSQAVQLLTSVTKDGDKSIDIILDIGEGLAAMGKGQAELDRIIVNLQQIAAVGKAATIDIKQFAFAGIPIYEMLTEATGKSGDALAELVDSGGVTFELLTQMFDKANDSGGRFFNAYVNQSGTFNQAMSNMKDSIGIFLSDIVKSSGLFDALTESMSRASTWLMNYKDNMGELSNQLGTFLESIEENTGLVTLLKDAWASIVSLYNEELRPALTDLWDTLQPLKPYLEALAQVIGFVLAVALSTVVILIQGFIEGLIKVLTWLTKLADFIASIFIDRLNGLRDAFSTVITSVEKLIERFKEAWEWAGKVASKTGSFAGNAITGALNFLLPGRATGGPVTGGSPYMVGERGPEVFVPRSSGTIIPNGAGGTTVNVVVNGDVSGNELVSKVQDAIMNSLRMNTRFAI